VELGPGRINKSLYSKPSIMGHYSSGSLNSIAPNSPSVLYQTMDFCVYLQDLTLVSVHITMLR